MSTGLQGSLIGLHWGGAMTAVTPRSRIPLGSVNRAPESNGEHCLTKFWSNTPPEFSFAKIFGSFNQLAACIEVRDSKVYPNLSAEERNTLLFLGTMGQF